MQTALEIGSAASATALAVALFKLALPQAPSWALVLVACSAGVALSLLVMVAAGVALDDQALAGGVLQGLFAAAAAAGVTRADAAGEARRWAAEAPHRPAAPPRAWLDRPMDEEPPAPRP